MKVYMVWNGYQGYHFVASTEEKAQAYIDSKSDEGCWVRSAWEIHDQEVDALFTGERGGD